MELGSLYLLWRLEGWSDTHVLADTPEQITDEPGNELRA